MNALRFLLVLPLALTAATFPAFADPPVTKHWKLVFSDEYDGSKLDESKWSRSTSHSEAFCWNGAKGLRCDDHADVDGQAFASDKPDRIFLELDGKPLTEFAFGTDFTTVKSWWGDYGRCPRRACDSLKAVTCCA